MHTIGYHALAMKLRYEITEENGWKPGEQLPSLRQLAAQYRSTHVTVRHALGVLAEEGLVVILHGRGTFIAGGTIPYRRRDEVEAHLRDKTSYVEDLGTVDYLARTLRASPSTVRRVLRTLIDEGLLHRHDNGTYTRTD